MTESNIDSKRSVSKRSGLGEKLLPLIKGLLFGGAILMMGLLVTGIYYDNSVLMGLGIILLGLYIWIAILAICQVPTPQEWPVELFGEYHRTLYPGLNFIVPGAERVRSKITVGATRVIKLFLKDKYKLDCRDDTMEMAIDIRVKVTESFAPTYEVIYTPEEILAIEKEEEDKGNTLLPENWMYMARARTEASMRAICGRLTLDEILESTSVEIEGTESEEAEFKFNKNVSAMVMERVNKALEKYGIVVEEIMPRDIELSETTVEARRAIQLAEKNVEVETVNVLKEEQIVFQAAQKALQEEQVGVGIQKMLDAIVADNPHLSRRDAMDYLIKLKLVESADNIDILSTGGEDDIIESLATRFGAASGLGNELTGERKKRRNKE